MIDYDKVDDIRTRCDIAEDFLVNRESSEDIVKCYRMLVEIRKDLDIAEEIIRKHTKSA